MNPNGKEETSGKNPIRQLIQDLAAQDPKVNESARLCLLSLRERSSSHLTEAIAGPNRKIRWEAMKILAEMRDPDLAPVLVRELENQDEDIRWLAAEGLLALGEAGLPSLLKALIERPSSTWLQQGARHVIKDLYLGRRHQGEEKYFTLFFLDENLRQKLRPILEELDRSEPQLKLPLLASAALDYWREK